MLLNVKSYTPQKGPGAVLAYKWLLNTKAFVASVDNLCQGKSDCKLESLV